MSTVKEAAAALVAKFKETTAVHDEVAALEAAIAADQPKKPKAAKKA